MTMWHMFMGISRRKSSMYVKFWLTTSIPQPLNIEQNMFLPRWDFHRPKISTMMPWMITETRSREVVWLICTALSNRMPIILPPLTTLGPVRDQAFGIWVCKPSFGIRYVLLAVVDGVFEWCL